MLKHGGYICALCVSTLCFVSQGTDVTFFGGAGQVGGSCALVENDKGKVLVDCGTFYGDEVGSNRQNESEGFGFNPIAIDAVLITHAHADHAGRVPQLVRCGFKGHIYMTDPTRQLLEISWKSQALYDDTYVREWQWSDKRHKVHWRKECDWTRKISSRNRKTFTGKYNRLKNMVPRATGCKSCAELDVLDCMTRITTVPYDQAVSLNGFKIVFRPVEHLPGSAAIYFDDGRANFVFSGDLGTARSRTSNPIHVSSKVDAVFLECTYGDKSKGDADDIAKEYGRFANIVTNALERGELIWIPAFAMDRTQRVMLELLRCGANPERFYSLSPSGNAITDLYLRNPKWFPNELGKLWDSFTKMQMTACHKFDATNHFRLCRSGVLLTTSGMMDTGFSYEFLRELLPRSDVTVCLVGYQSVGTPGRQLKEGRKTITLRDGAEIPVTARVESFDCFSGHGDARENDVWLGENVKSKIYLVHGDAEALKARKEDLEKRFGAEVAIVKKNQRYPIGSIRENPCANCADRATGK